MSNSPLQQISMAYESGHAALLLTGRSPYDLVVNNGERSVQTLHEALRRDLRHKFGMALLTFTRSAGFDWDKSRIEDERDRKAIEQVIQVHNLLQIAQDEHETAKVIRGVSSLLRNPTDGLKWANGAEMRFAVLFEFAEHIAPGGLLNGTQTDNQIISIELAASLAQSLALRKSGNLLIFHGRDGLLDDLVKNALHAVHLKLPDEIEKNEFLQFVASKYSEAKFEAGLTSDTVARMTSNTPNRGLEALLLASQRTGQEITASELSEQKSRDVEAVTEGTVKVLDTNRIKDVELRGRNIEVAKRFLEQCAEGLLKGDANIPSNILLVGPPGTAKTDLCLITARKAQVAAYELINPKGGIVGETERKVRLQWSAVREWIPNITFIDEMSEAVPVQRTEWDGDSGASRAIVAQLLTALSDESRRGRTMLIATTNTPWRMGEALRTRFTLMPVLFPLQEDFPGIIVVTARRISPQSELDENDSKVIQAAKIFCEKGASPRHIRAQLSNNILFQRSLTADTILSAAEDFCASTDRVSATYAELWAIKACSSKSFFPWNENVASYPFPEHLKGIVTLPGGDIDRAELEKRLKELEPYVNV
jgi:AAA+ superfamily predicted ATPase